MKLSNLLFGIVSAALVGSAFAQEFDIKQDDTIVSAMNYGKGDHVVIALHGFKQSRDFLKAYGDEIASAGFRVIAVDWSAERGAGFKETDAAVKFARAQGAKKISLLGTSRGAELAANYAMAQPDGDIDALILVSDIDDKGIALTKTKKLFIYSKDDRFVQNGAPKAAEKSVEPKQVIVLDGGSHGMAQISENAELMKDILATLKR